MPPAETSARLPGPTRTAKLSVTKPPTARIAEDGRRVGDVGQAKPAATASPPTPSTQNAAVSADMA